MTIIAGILSLIVGILYLFDVEVFIPTTRVYGIIFISLAYLYMKVSDKE